MSRALCIASFAAVFVTAACRAPSPRAPGVATVDTLFYISARARDDGRERPRLADSLEYGIVLMARPTMDDPTEDRASIEILDSLQLSVAEFSHRLAERIGPASDSSRFAVMYTHGYGTSLHNLWQHSALARLRSRGDQPWVLFSWPSIGSGVAWPRDGDVLTTAYRADSTAAAASRGAFAQALATAADAVGHARLVLIAHSLGGQMVGESLREHHKVRSSLEARPLRAIAFVSPDIELARFGSTVVPALRPLTERLLLYASADDRVLMMSAQVNRSRRAGRVVADSGPPTFPGLESVDMTEGRYANSWLVNTFGTRHALRRKSAALFDLVHIVGGQRAATCREQLGTATSLGLNAWKLTNAALPPIAKIAECAPFQRSAP